MSRSRIASIVAIVGAFAWTLFVGEVKQSILVGVIAVAIAALGLDLLVARTGELSLAHAAFLGIGAFTAVNAGSRGCAWPVSMLLAVVVTAAAATIAGLPSLRIRGLQVAIVTLAFQEFAEVYLFSRQDVTAAGRSIDRPPFLRDDIRLYLFAVVALVLVLVVRQRIGVTKSGRQFLAVRDLGDRARSFGVEPGPTKLYAYALSGAIVGLGGAVLALKAGSISAKDPFLLLESLTLVAIVVVGGAGSAAGIITAAVVIKALPQFSSTVPLTNVRADRVIPIASAGLLVFVIVVAPRGIGGVYHWIGRALDARPRPDPRPHPTDLASTANHAVVLRDVPRPLWLRMPVPALLEADDVHVTYGGVSALAGISLEVRRGEIVGLIGANGAGKSTFFNAVSGFAPTQGSIRYRGVELVGRPAATRSRFGVARTFQDLGLVRAETVAENVLLAQTWLARYPASAGIIGLGSTVPTERELRRRADLALELFGLDHLAHERLGDLPYGTMRMVEIASAVAAGPDILLLDEATAGLDPHASHELGDRFLALREALGITLVIVEHHVPLVARVCDYVYCLESGTLIAEGKPDDVTDNPEVVASFLGRGHATGERERVTNDVLLTVEHLDAGYGSLQVLFDVSLDVRAGEVVALMGSNGAGKTTTMRALTGLLKRSGRITFAGNDITNAPAESLVAQGIVLVPEGRGMFRELTVSENLELGAYSVRDRAAVADATERAFGAFPILAERRAQKAGSLSGGQQQMLALARALMSAPRLLLVDEASLGLSPAMTESVFELLDDARKRARTAVLLVEQNAAALDLAARAFVLEKGQVVDRAEGDAVRGMQRRLRDAYLGKSE